MQEINELKNLVIQSLEGNGVLGQIRAQIRASIFKTIEMQETTTKKNAGFYWENPLCQTIYDNKEGKLALELINDFLEFFKMDYTLSIFTHESNLKEAARREELLKKLGIKGDGNKPILFHIISALQHPHEASPSKENFGMNPINREAQKVVDIKPKPAASNIGTKNITTDFQDPGMDKKNFDNFGKNKKGGFPPFEEPQEDLSRKTGKLAPLSSVSPQDKFGSNKLQATDLLGEAKKQVEDLKKPADLKKPGNIYNTGGEKFKSQQDPDYDEYEDEVFEKVDEELVDDLEEEDPKNKDKKSMLTSSEDIIGASQSQGFDVSVDSLALEEYDYYEHATKPR